MISFKLNAIFYAQKMGTIAQHFAMTRGKAAIGSDQVGMESMVLHAQVHLCYYAGISIERDAMTTGEKDENLERMRVARMEEVTQLIKKDLESPRINLRFLLCAGLIILIIYLVTVPMDRYVSVVHSAF